MGLAVDWWAAGLLSAALRPILTAKMSTQYHKTAITATVQRCVQSIAQSQNTQLLVVHDCV